MSKDNIIYVRVPAHIKTALDGKIKETHGQSTAGVIRKVLEHLIDLTEEEQRIILETEQTHDAAEENRRLERTIVTRISEEIKDSPSAS